MNKQEQATGWIDNAKNYAMNEEWNNEKAALAYAQVYATLHLAEMQRERNRLAALTAKHRGLDMTGFEHLLERAEND